MSETPLKADFEGILHIGKVKIACAVLEDGTRVLTRRGFLAAIGRNVNAPRANSSDDKPPPFLAAKNLQPFVEAEIHLTTTPIRFRTKSRGNIAHGYRAELLPQVCRVYMLARAAGKLLPSQMPIASRCELLTLGICEVGIISLVDEASGAQQARDADFLQRYLQDFLLDHPRPWERTFPPEFYREIYRLQRWPYDPDNTEHSPLVGQITRDIIYKRVGPKILEKLDELNPVNEFGKRMAKFHSYTSTGIGLVKLKEHMAKVQMLMELSSDWADFMRKLDEHLPLPNATMFLELQVPGTPPRDGPRTPPPLESPSPNYGFQGASGPP